MMMTPKMTLEEFRTLLGKYNLLKNNRLQRAIDIVVSSFEGHKRDDGSDVISQHLLPMTSSLIEYYNLERARIDVNVIIGALLHDILEDVKDFDSAGIGNVFGDKVFSIVCALTKQKSIKRKGYRLYGNRLKYNAEYYSQIRSSPKEVKLIKAADRLNNLESAYTNPDRNKVDNYVRETEEIYLSIFNEFPYFYQRISQELARLREYQASSDF